MGGVWEGEGVAAWRKSGRSLGGEGGGCLEGEWEGAGRRVEVGILQFFISVSHRTPKSLNPSPRRASMSVPMCVCAQLCRAVCKCVWCGGAQGAGKAWMWRSRSSCTAQARPLT